MNLTPLQQKLREEWEADKQAEAFRQQMVRWDKKLSHLNDEMLYYVFNRASSIIEYRQEQADVAPTN